MKLKLKKTLETYILQIIDVVSKLLQNEIQNIGEATKHFTNPYQQMKELHTQFIELNNTAKTLAAKWETSTKFILKGASRPKLCLTNWRACSHDGTRSR
jgi:FtsZ-binding cell division protein ZapB